MVQSSSSIPRCNRHYHSDRITNDGSSAMKAINHRASVGGASYLHCEHFYCCIYTPSPILAKGPGGEEIVNHLHTPTCHYHSLFIVCDACSRCHYCSLSLLLLALVAAVFFCCCSSHISYIPTGLPLTGIIPAQPIQTCTKTRTRMYPWVNGYGYIAGTGAG
jgi:hypothetical protein